MSDLTAGDFKAGECARATVAGERGVLLMRRVTPNHSIRYWLRGDGEDSTPMEHEVTDLRRAHVLPAGSLPPPEGSVTLDPENVQHCSDLVKALRAAGASIGQPSIDVPRGALRALAAEQAAPPVPPEPPRDALVSDEEGNVWRYVDDDDWECITDSVPDVQAWGGVAERLLGQVTILRPDTAPTPSRWYSSAKSVGPVDPHLVAFNEGVGARPEPMSDAERKARMDRLTPHKRGPL